MNSDIPHRTLHPGVALDVARAEIKRLNLRTLTATFGSEGWPTPRCSLMGLSDSPVARGAGKGRPEQSITSAYFEALEHLYADRVPHTLRAGTTGMVSARELGNRPELRRDRVIRRLAACFPDARVGCGLFHALAPPAPALAYPLFLVAPKYAASPASEDDLSYRSLLRYSAGVGTAAGVGLAEALVHALLERLEHDAVSLALIEWFLLHKRSGYLLEPTTLPGQERRLWSAVEEELATKVHVIDVTSDLEVPVYLAVPEKTPFRVGTSGAGCSPYPAYAVQRALTELLQDARLRSADGQTALDESFAMHGALAKWPMLQACARMAGSSLIERLAGDHAPLRGGGKAAPPHDDATRLTELLCSAGLTPYALVLTPPCAAVTVVTVIVPGLETFTVVRGGVPVLPTGRGAALPVHYRSKSTV